MNPYGSLVFPQVYGNESNQAAGMAIMQSMGMGREAMGQGADPSMNPLNPLNAYNPYALARMMQMQQMGEGTGQQKLEKIAEPTVQDVLRERLKFASNITAQTIISSDKPIFILGFGPQYSGKTSFLKATMDTLEKNGIQTEVYSPASEEEKEIGKNADDFLPSNKVSHISELYEVAENPDIKSIFIDQIDKLGNADEIKKFVSFANSHKISVIASSSYFKHNGTVIESLPEIVNNSTAAFEFLGIDTLDEKSPAQLNYTGIPISPEGEILDSTGDTYYSNLEPIELKMVINKFLQLPGKDKLLVNGPFEGHEEVKQAILLPLHPNDVVSSTEKARTLSMSVQSYDQLYRLANITPPPKTGFQSVKVQDWTAIGL